MVQNEEQSDKNFNSAPPDIKTLAGALLLSSHGKKGILETAVRETPEVLNEVAITIDEYTSLDDVNLDSQAPPETQAANRTRLAALADAPGAGPKVKCWGHTRFGML